MKFWDQMFAREKASPETGFRNKGTIKSQRGALSYSVISSSVFPFVSRTNHATKNTLISANTA